MRLNRATILLLIAAGMFSCVEPYTPKTIGYDEMLMIEGIIFDDPAMMPVVTISRSIPLNRDGGSVYESGAEVSVECDDGISFPFFETSPGVYTTAGVPVIPEQGKRYRLMVVTGDRKVYASAYEPYTPPASIDSVTYRAEYTKVSEIGEWEYGLKFYANASNSDDKPLYLRWILDATYNYSVPFPGDFIWTGSVVENYLGPDYRFCWKSMEIPGIFIADSDGMEDNRVADAELNFVSQYGDQLTIRYSLNVVQLTIPRSAYEFWYDLKKMIDDTGGLYETQPFRIRGNIECISDPDTEAGGVFEVAGVSRTRVFADRPTEFEILPYNCSLIPIGPGGLSWDFLPANIFVTELDVDKYATTLQQQCYDCRLRGGTTARPPFWE